jgi:hypothetical protein
MGVVAMVASLSVVLDCVRLTSTVAVPVTVTVSATVEGFITGESVSVWPTVRVTPSCTMVAKPARLTVTV